MKTRRKVVVLGHSLQELINTSIDNGYINFDKNRIGDLSNIDDKDVVILVSDEKEKPFANLERIINGFDKYVKLKKTDTVFITEPSYAGIEKRLAQIIDMIAIQDINVINLSYLSFEILPFSTASFIPHFSSLIWLHPIYSHSDICSLNSIK